MPKLTIDDVFELIARDGLIETIDDISPKHVIDEPLRELLEQAQDLIERIEAYVEDNRIMIDGPFETDDDEDTELDDE